MQLVKVGRLEDRVAVAAQVGIALVVGKYKYDVWYTRFLRTFSFISAEY
jgi:hypothetical protein